VLSLTQERLPFVRFRSLRPTFGGLRRSQLSWQSKQATQGRPKEWLIKNDVRSEVVDCLLFRRRGLKRLA